MNNRQDRILIVDDIEANRDLLSRVLARAGYLVDKAEGGATALQVLNTGAYSLVLLDILMPEVNGFMVLESMRQQSGIANVPVIMISALGEREDVVKSLKLGANDYITKPFDKEILLSRVHRQLETSYLYRQLYLSEERYKLAFAASNDGLLDWDIEQDKIFFSGRWLEMMGIAEETQMHSIEQWFERVYPDDVAALRQAIYHQLSDQSASINHEYRAQISDGHYSWMLCRAKVLFTESGKAIRITVSQSDISGSKVFDPITGLPNSLVFMDRLTRVHANAKRAGKVDFALFSMSLVNKKKITSAIGPAGYESLSTDIAQRLNAMLLVDDYLTKGSRQAMLSCISDQRYMLLIEGIDEKHAMDLFKIGEHLCAAVEPPFIVFGETIHCSLSVGICIPVEVDQSVDDIIKHSVTAEAMGHKDNCRVSFYDATIHGIAIDYLRFENELRTAISRNELRTFYQPIIELGNERQVGSESLVRWEHPDRGLLSPSHFISLAEEMGIIGFIDEWVLRDSCAEYMRTANREGRSSGFISVNVSVTKLNLAWVERVRSIVEEFSIPPECLHLEITESIFMGDMEATISLLNELVDIGVSFAIDDFGTGYSCFSYLRRLPASYLKIDKSFIDDMVDDVKARLLVQNIIQIGHGLGMKMIAEGVEKKEQADMLLGMGCNYGQGYYFGRPEPAKAV
ncbi:putative bifunctional diguanylate cyclase/phosphodiesterase [Neptunomonas antarctica]|uniref:PAS domain S-box-containing protein n=1 Tax=Neptunomonas antarctica TaxID=619304 RepID=A0A1N7LZY8_9GAMM|nr:EAL domain-containing protein [Neptunomonas antarctica]SIS79396.1 PAS domain S-box-containing protein [Neptunomonas antarctica]